MHPTLNNPPPTKRNFKTHGEIGKRGLFQIVASIFQKGERGVSFSWQK